MAERNNRDPTYDLGRHIATGEKGPLSGDPALRQYDAELDRNNPMDDFTAGKIDNYTIPQTAEAVTQANLAQAAGLSPQYEAEGNKPQEYIDMAQASNCDDEPTKGGITYGPRFTGGY